MSWAKLILLIAITVGVTWLIVWLDSAYRQHIKTDPNAAQKSGVFRSIAYLLLNLLDIPK
jgi:uncharacterized iron-regulated membrane protein